MELNVKKIKIEGNKFTINYDDNTVVVEKSRFGEWLNIEFEPEIDEVLHHYSEKELLEYVSKWDVLESLPHNDLLRYIENNEDLKSKLADILKRRERFLKLNRILK